jgi:DNA-binding GntR family transcriptional regulator
MPVREAVRRLEAEGLVEQVPHRGAQVRPVSVPDLDLSRVLVEYREAYERGDDARGREMHAAFHLGLYEVSQSRWLMHTITPLFNVADRYQRLSSVLRGSLESRYQEHERILECCRQRDAEAAAEALEDHLRKTMNVIKAELDGSVEDATSSADEETGGTVGA